MKRELSDIHGKVLSRTRTEELAALAELPEDQINTDDVPEQTDWANARRGVFFRPVKKQLTLRLDADLVEWFKSRATEREGYQTSINKALRAFVLKHEQSTR